MGDSYECKFCDLFVRETNNGANAFYDKLGYVVFRIVNKYYHTEDAFDKRKCLKSDPEKKSIKGAGRTIKDWVDYTFW